MCTNHPRLSPSQTEPSYVLSHVMWQCVPVWSSKDRVMLNLDGTKKSKLIITRPQTSNHFETLRARSLDNSIAIWTCYNRKNREDMNNNYVNKINNNGRGTYVVGELCSTLLYIRHSIRHTYGLNFESLLHHLVALQPLYENLLYPS